jgi:hypothetical protein
MSTAVWVSVVVGSMALAGNLVNGYLQRKQMRQNELFRQDPSAGLIPPRHPLWVHLWKYRTLYWNGAWSAFLVIIGFLLPRGPMTRGSVVNISSGVCLFYYGLISYTRDKIVSVLENHRDMAEAHDKILAITVGNVDTLAKTVGIALDNLDLKNEIEKHRCKK